MTNGEDNHPLCVEAISCNIGTLSKLNDELAVFWRKVIDEAPDLGTLRKLLDFPPNRLLSSKGSVLALWSKELVKPNHIQ